MFKLKKKKLFVFVSILIFSLFLNISNALTSSQFRDSVLENKETILNSFNYTEVDKLSIKPLSPMYIIKELMEAHPGKDGFNKAPLRIYYTVDKDGVRYSGFLTKNKSKSIYDERRNFWFVFYEGELFFR